MPESLEILPVYGMGDITPATDLAERIILAAPWLRDGDVLVVTSKIVSKAEGRLVDVPPSGPEREAAREEVLTAETARPVARRGHTRIVQTHHGFVMASAGVDTSNVDRSTLVLLPKDPDASARALRTALRERTGLNVAVIVSDTMGRPWRNALTDVALGAAGIDAVRDHRGETDAYGNELLITQMAAADELAGAAELVKGKRDQVPVAVVRGFLAEPPGRDGDGAVVLVRDAAQDLFSLGTAEARAAGLAEAARLVDATQFGDGRANTSGVARAIDASASVRSGGITLELVTSWPDDAARPSLPVNTVCVVACGSEDSADPAQLFALGEQVHRLRCALAAEGLATVWLPTAPDAGWLAVGHSAAGSHPAAGS
jgi:coenzyme F420-0:L-glutamate ligase/coenzyme F420-1:gamma-L-glutamate ligase